MSKDLRDEVLKKLDAIGASLEAGRLTAEEAGVESAKLLQQLDGNLDDRIDRIVKGSRARQRRLVILGVIFASGLIAYRIFFA